MKDILKYSLFVLAGYLLIMSSISSCTVNQSIAGKNVSYLYRDLSPELEADHKVINFDDRSLVYLKFATENLGKSVDEDGVRRLNYSIRYRLFTSYSAEAPIDSGNIVRKDVSAVPMTIVDTFSLMGLESRSYMLQCILRDLTSPRTFTMFIQIQRGSGLNHQSLVIASSVDGMLYRPYINQPDSLWVNEIDQDRPLFAKFYDREFPIASPPFSTVRPKPFDFNPDKLIALDQEDDAQRLIVIQKGFYQITPDPESRTGATIHYFGPYYPEAKTVMDLALPLRYITTNEEYNALFDGENIKRNVDQHWLDVGGNPERARELIGAFYGRVQYANRYFTSYLEGWKTDRGMCYIVYGPPDAVYRSTATETWLYGEEGKYNSLSLTFTKVVNPFTNSDYRLNRSTNLKSSWYRAVEFWRQGRVLKYQ